MNNLYERISIETEVLQASPHRQIQLLLDRCVQLILLSGHYLELQDTTNKCKAITKATDIITYLDSILKSNDKESEKLSKSLSDTYRYIEKQLVMANMKNDQKYLNDSLEKVRKVKESWDAIGESRE